MNIREGIRRAFVVLSVLLTAFVFAVACVMDFPREPNAYEWSMKVKHAVQADLDPTEKFTVQWESSDYGTVFIKDSCKKAQLPMLKEVCQDYAKAEDGLLWEQAKYLRNGLFATAITLVSCWLLWVVSAWVLSGFARPKEITPK